MNKFTGKKTTKKVIKKVEAPKGVEVIKKGSQEFVKCPKCGWIHPVGTTKCRFCGKKF